MKRIGLTQNKYALVDDGDFDSVNQFDWCAWLNGSNWYVIRKIPHPDHPGKWKRVYLHRFLMPHVKPPLRIDHINGDGLDNRRENLREATNQQNAFNPKKRMGTSSRFLGVTWYRRHKKWTACIKFNGKKKHLGYFDSELGAAKARDVASKQLFGEFAKLNFT